MSVKLLSIIFVLSSALRAFSWTDGELLIWISDNRGFRALEALGKKFEEEMGVPVKVETQEQITEKFQAAAQGGKGPDIFFWAHDRIGEWADAGLLKPLEIKEEFKSAFIPMSWEAVAHNKQTLGLPSRPRMRLPDLQQEARIRKAARPALGISCLRQGT